MRNVRPIGSTEHFVKLIISLLLLLYHLVSYEHNRILCLTAGLRCPHRFMLLFGTASCENKENRVQEAWRKRRKGGHQV
jgi:hypothetical protein